MVTGLQKKRYSTVAVCSSVENHMNNVDTAILHCHIILMSDSNSLLPYGQQRCFGIDIDYRTFRH